MGLDLRVAISLLVFAICCSCAPVGEHGDCVNLGDGGGPRKSRIDSGARELYFEAERILSSEAFIKNLSDTEKVYGQSQFSVEHGAGSATKVFASIDGPVYKKLPICVRVVGSGSGDDASERFHAGASISRTGARVQLSMGSEIVREFLSVSSVTRSCAVHTMAHEISHSIIYRKSGYMVFADTYSGGVVADSKDVPISTYMIGSVAQCTYLQNINAMKDDSVVNCVKRFGVRRFNVSECYGLL